MAKHIVKCRICGQSFDANVEPFVKLNTNRYAHQACAEAAENQKTQEEKDKEQLEKYIKELFEIKSLTPKINRQIKDFHEKNGYSYSGMYKTLKYFFVVRGNDIAKANGGIGIIPWVWNESYLYWRALWEAQQENSNKEAEQYQVPIREIHIPPPRREPIARLANLFNFLDEEEVEE